MKLKTQSILAFCLLLNFTQISAQILGGQIKASLISANTIEVQAAVYRDCRGVSLASKNFSYGCFVGVNGGNLCGMKSLTPPTFKSKDVTYLYKGQTVPCNPPNIAGPTIGMEMMYFTDTIDLSSSGILNLISGSSCTEITFYLQKCCRNSTFTNGSQSTLFTITATVNYLNLLKCKKKTNIAPDFAFAPKMRLTDQELHVFTPAPYDLIDNDKLVCKLTSVYSDIPKNSVTLSSPYKENAPVQTFCIPSGNGFCTPSISSSPVRGFNFDTTEALMVFQPNITNTLGAGSMANTALHCYEYRLDSNQKWIQIGRSMREFELIHLNTAGNNNPPTINSNSSMLAVAGKPFYYEFKITDVIKSPAQSTADTLKVELVSGCKAFSIYVKNPKDREKTIVITGTPDSSYISKVPYRMSVLANDQYGQYLAIASRQIMIHVKPLGKFTASTSFGQCNRLILKSQVDKSIPGNFEYYWTITDLKTGKIQFSSRNANDSSMSLTNGRKYIKLTILNENYGFETFYDTVDAKNEPTFSILGDLTVCEGNKLDIKANPLMMKSIQNVEYVIDNAYSYIDTINHFSHYRIDSSVNINAVATDILGCKSTLDFKVTAIKKPLKQFSNPVLLCQNDPDADLLAYVNIKNSDTIKFSAGQGLIYSDRYFATKNISPKEFTSSNSVSKRIYYALVDTNNCLLSDSTEVIVRRLPSTNLLHSEFCQNQMVQDLNKLIISPGASSLPLNYYRWKVILTPTLAKGQTILSKKTDKIDHYFQFGTKSDTIFGGQYKFQFYYYDSSTKCGKYDTLKILVNNEPKITISKDPFYCSNKKRIDLLSLVKNDNSPASFGIFELLSHNNSSTSGIFFGTKLISNRYFPKTAADGIWKFSYLDPLTKCKDTGFSSLKIAATPVAFFKTSDTLIDELTPNIKALNFSSISDNSQMDFLWNPGTSKPSDMSTLKDFNFTYPNVPAIYNLKLVTSNFTYGCSDTFQKTIKVQKNVGVHDLNRYQYKINSQGIISDFEGHFVLGKWYNETGQLVQTDKNNLGISLKSGIYFYEISINHNDSLKIIKGKILQP